MADEAVGGFLRQTREDGELGPLVTHDENLSGASIGPLGLQVDAGLAFNGNRALVDVEGVTLNAGDITLELDSHVSTVNSTNTPLAAGAEFVGDWESCVDAASITISALTDQNAAYAAIEFSHSGIGEDVVETLAGPILADIPVFSVLAPRAAFFRCRVLNGATPQTVLKSQVVLHFSPIAADSGPLGSYHTQLTNAEVVKAVMAAYNPTTQLMDLLRVDPTTGELLVRTGALTDDELRAAPLEVSGDVELAGADALAQEATVGMRYSGGKAAAVLAPASSGTHTIVTPGAGKYLRVFWVSAIPSPDAESANLLTIGGDGITGPLYKAYAVSHWEPFDLDVDEALTIELAAAESVAVTVHYQEMTV